MSASERSPQRPSESSLTAMRSYLEAHLEAKPLPKPVEKQGKATKYPLKSLDLWRFRLSFSIVMLQEPEDLGEDWALKQLEVGLHRRRTQAPVEEDLDLEKEPFGHRKRTFRMVSVPFEPWETKRFDAF